MNHPYAAIVFAFAFSSLGACFVCEHRSSSEELKEGRVSLIVEITEANQNDKLWKKTLACVTHVKTSDTLLPLKSELLMYAQPKFHPGDVIFLDAEIKRIKNANNPGEFDAKSYWNNQNIQFFAFVGHEDYTYIDHKAQHTILAFFDGIRSALSDLIDDNLSPESGGIAKALLLGDKGSLSSETRNSFSNAGAMHVLAVSGLHVGIIMYLLMFVLGKFSRLISKRFVLLISIGFVWIYAAVTGFSPSVMRAAFMFSVLVIGQMTSKRSSGLNTLFFSAFVLLLINPLFVYDIGFQLSYLAMLGIMMFYQPIAGLILIRQKGLKKLWEGTAIGIAAQLLTVPLTLYYFHQFPNYFMVSNLGVMLFAGVLLVLGLLLFSFSGIGILLSVFSVLLGFGIVGLLAFIQFVERIPGAVATGFVLSSSVVFILYGILLILFVFKKRRRVVQLSIAIAGCVFIVIQVDRFGNMNKKELVVFNSNIPIIAYKSVDKIICLYAGRKEDVKKVAFLMEGYRKVRPGEIEYVQLKDGKTRIHSKQEDLTFDVSSKQIRFKKGDKNYLLRRHYRSGITGNVHVIDMPYLESGEEHYNLSKGAFVIEL